MGFFSKIKGASGILGQVLGAGGDIIEGKSNNIGNRASTITDIIVGEGTRSVQRPLDKIYHKIEKATGFGFGRPGVGEIINNPTEALAQFLRGGLSSSGDAKGGWYPLLKNRPDPLWDIDWIAVLPFGLPPEYVEEITWTMPRFDTDAVFRNGKSVNIVTKVENAALNIVLYEDNLLTATGWYHTWQNQIFNPKAGTFNYPAFYKKNIYVVIRDVRQQAIGQAVFGGCIPTGAPTLTHASEGQRVKVTIEVSVDSIAFEAVSIKGDAVKASENLIDSFKRGMTGNITTLLGDAATVFQGGFSKAKSFITSAFGGLSKFF